MRSTGSEFLKEAGFIAKSVIEPKRCQPGVWLMVIKIGRISVKKKV